MAYVATPSSQPRANRASWIFALFSLKTRELLREPLDASGNRTLCIGKLKSKGLYLQFFGTCIFLSEVSDF